MRTWHSRAALAAAAFLAALFPAVSLAAAEPAVRLTIVVDNTSTRPDLKAVWGFACLVEAQGHTFLFDTGADPAVLRDNLAALKVDPKRIEAVIISHFHSDHTLGAPGLGTLSGVRAYTPHSFDPYVKQAGALDAAGLARVPVAKATPLGAGVAITEPMPFGKAGSKSWEQALTIDTPQGLVVLVGCSHPGIEQMVAQIRKTTTRPIHLVLGGFHLRGTTAENVRALAGSLRDMGVVRLGATHCTGDDTIPVFRETYGSNFVPGGAGTVIEIPATAGVPPPSFACDYLGETPPGDEPVVFGRGVVSVEGKNTHAAQFSPDGRLLIFSRYPDGTSYVMRRGPEGWSKPERTSFTGKEVTFDAARKRLFYYAQGGDLFWVRYADDGFSAPTKLDAKINTRETEFYPSMTQSGNLYFGRNGNWQNGRVLLARPSGEDFEAPVDLGDHLNTGGLTHAFVAPDESYMLFNSLRPGSHTRNDIWASFRQADGSWSGPVNLGPRTNSDPQSAMLCPTVSPDGKYLFFTRLQASRTGLLYWVSTNVIDQARKKAAKAKAAPRT